MLNEKMELVKKEGGELRKELLSSTSGYIMAGLGLVVGLAWNDAIKAAIEKFFPMDGGGILARFGYAIIATVFIVMISRYLMKKEAGR